MSVTINQPARITVTMNDGRLLEFSEEELALTWSFGAPRGDFGEWLNFVKWLAETFGENHP